MPLKTAVTLRLASNHLPAVTKAMDAAVTDEIKRAGFEIEAAAKGRVPVLTGTLRRSIHTVISNGGQTATVGPSVNYGIYVELGARGRSGRPYMRPAAELVYPKFVDRLKGALRRSGSAH